MATEYETILVDFDRGVTTITLNRPEQRNAINLTMEQELYAAIQAAEDDDTVRAIVVTGAGIGVLQRRRPRRRRRVRSRRPRRARRARSASRPTRSGSASRTGA